MINRIKQAVVSEIEKLFQAVEKPALEIPEELVTDLKKAVAAIESWAKEYL